MRSLFNDIGLVTAGLRAHLTRLASIENDPQGSTSTIEDEETDEQKALREQAEEDARLDDEGGDERSRRGRDTAAYRELQGTNDKLRADLDKQHRENQEFRERLTKIEGEKTARETTNEQTNANLDLARRRSREIIAEINKLPADDPDRNVKIYETFLSKVYDDLPRMAEDISKRTSRETFTRERTLDQQQVEAKRLALAELQKQGLDDDDYELVEALATHKSVMDKDWFEHVKEEDQIPELVKMVKDRIVKSTRSSQEFQDEKHAHQRPMRGVIEQGSQRRVRDQEDDASPRKGPGSILADMARAKEARRLHSNRMIRSIEH